MKNSISFLLICVYILISPLYVHSNCFNVNTEKESDLITITGSLVLTSTPCPPDEVCLPCLTPAILADDIVYYINKISEEELSEKLNLTLDQEWNHTVTAEGFVFENDGIKMIDIENIYSSSTSGEDIIQIKDKNYSKIPQKVFQEGSLQILLPDGRRFDAMGREIK